MIQDNSLAGLKKAELLMLHSNDIQHLQDEVFRDMKSLQVNKVKLQQSSTNCSVFSLFAVLFLTTRSNQSVHIGPLT